MSCFYCGKRVSLVRKRSDADFCCDEHREKYHARTRRGMDRLLEAEERLATTRRLSEGFPLRAHAPCPGAALEGLTRSGADSLASFRLPPAGLPSSRPALATHVAAGVRMPVRVPRPSPQVSPPRAESALWMIGRAQQAPRPPKPLQIQFGLPRIGLLAAHPNGRPQLRAPRLQACPAPDMASAAGVVFPKVDARRTRSIIAFACPARPPTAITPPPARQPFPATLQPPAMRIVVGERRAAHTRVRLPESGWVSLAHAPLELPIRPARLAWVRLVPRKVMAPAAPFGAPGMRKPADWKGVARLVPCPEGSRRRRFYDQEELDRFCTDIGFHTVADHRPGIRIAAAPHLAALEDVARLWTRASDDRHSAAPEPRCPAQPFQEQLALPALASPLAVRSLPAAAAAVRNAPSVDLSRRLPESATWAKLGAALALTRRQSAPTGTQSRAWARGTAGALRLAEAARPCPRGFQRMACVAGIQTRPPVYSGPLFRSGRCQTSPAPLAGSAAPLYSPPAAPARRERVPLRRARLIIASVPNMQCGLRSTGILARPLAPPVSGEGKTTLSGREPLDRFRKNGHVPIASRPTAPCWSAATAAKLIRVPAQQPCAHAPRPLNREPALAMIHAGRLPDAALFARVCALRNSPLAAPALPTAAEFGRRARAEQISFRELVRLPFDALRPIRDWGLAAPPAPETASEPIYEDFAAGLTGWLGNTADWKQDLAGVRTGSLALLEPSLHMAHYEFEFLGKIENQSIGWVFRATDANHYQAARITLGGESSGAAELVRYTVLGGKKDLPVARPLKFPLARNASCRVRMSVRGNVFTVFVNDQPAGQWSDSRLPEGGVGFFSAAEDDRARLYWVKVTPLCEPPRDVHAQLAPARTILNSEIRTGV